MKVLHLTETKNLRSIYKHGIIPTRIQLDHHWRRFKQDGLKQRKCIYTWNANTYENGRFVKDMIYCRQFIHPRNAVWNDDENELLDYTKFGKKLYNFSGDYTLLEFDFDVENTLKTWFIHAQEPGEDKYCSLVYLDEKYAHDDKEMLIFKNTIKTGIKPVEQILVRKYKDEGLGFTFRKI